jgi:hypothetical protein
MPTTVNKYGTLEKVDLYENGGNRGIISWKGIFNKQRFTDAFAEDWKWERW